ncbi:Translin [Lipomyces arxii]|uniref:Translin n=1 Tax=Lipomyces arxii TaxID=56418 RepID=UPI0034CE794D
MSSIERVIDLEIFNQCQDKIDRDSEIRENLDSLTKAIDQHTRSILSILSTAHSVPSSSFQTFETRTSTSFEYQRDAIQKLAKIAASHPFFKYNSIWNRTLQNAAFAVLFKNWLVNEGSAYIESSTSLDPLMNESNTNEGRIGKLTSFAAVCEALGIKPDFASENEFHLTLEQYLQAIISLINELSRLAINSVIMAENGNYSTPVRVNYFIKQLQAGFLMLNLKNDALRPRVDSIKYDAKKAEEVIYDLALRGLISKK